MDEVPEHKHCKVCGKSIPPDDTTCSKDCANKRAQSMQTRRRWNYAFLVIMFLLVVLLVFELTHA
jgi:predicted nucleic acid-binding Zn ribbon protein